MIKDKILIFCDYPIKENEGGPIGYFNKCIYNNIPDNVLLLKTLLKEVGYISLKKKIEFRKDYILNKIRGQKYFDNSLANKFIKIDASKYKFLYFHSIYDLSDVLHLINEDQIIILQSHSPELPSIERKNNGSTDYLKVAQLEKITFDRANYLVFPNEDCVPMYSELIKDQNKIKYLLTGIKPLKSLINFPIDKNKINIIYIGRRNDVKGFNFLIESFRNALKNRNDLRLFIAGNGEKIIGDDIYDIGTTQTPFDWINSVDFVVSLNKTSYFDLNVIETICVGTPLIMTTTQGHKYFKNQKGIISVTYESFLKTLMDPEIVYKKFKMENEIHLKQLYSTCLSKDIFNANLKNLCKSIIEETDTI